MKQSDTIGKSKNDYSTSTRYNQTYTQKEIDENVLLLKTYYAKIRTYEELRKRHFFYLNTILNWRKSDIAKRYAISRERVGQILRSVKKGVFIS